MLDLTKLTQIADEGCQNFATGNCYHRGRTDDATFSKDMACYPCRIAALLSSDLESLPPAAQGVTAPDAVWEALENAAAILGRLVENPLGAYSTTKTANAARDCITALSLRTAPPVPESAKGGEA